MRSAHFHCTTCRDVLESVRVLMCYGQEDTSPGGLYVQPPLAPHRTKLMTANVSYRDVLEGVLVLMGQDDTSWSAMKTFLGKRSVKEDIINFDARR